MSHVMTLEYCRASNYPKSRFNNRLKSSVSHGFRITRIFAAQTPGTASTFQRALRSASNGQLARRLNGLDGLNPLHRPAQLETLSHVRMCTTEEVSSIDTICEADLVNSEASYARMTRIL